MSVAAYKAVWERTKQTGTPLNVLLALADFADTQGHCWPSLARLAEMTHVSRRNVQKAVALLEAAGDITVNRGRGRTHTSLYILHPGGKGVAYVTLSPELKVSQDAEKVSEKVVKGVGGDTRSVRTVRTSARASENGAETPIPISTEVKKHLEAWKSQQKALADP